MLAPKKALPNRLILYSIGVFSLLSLVFLGGCLDKRSVVSASAPDRLVLAIESEPSNLNPLYATDANSQNLGTLLYNSLVKIDRNLTPVPDLASSMHVEKNRFYTFKLKQNIKFHDGRSVTSEDVKRSILLYQSDKMKSPFQGVFQKIKNIKTPSPWVINFETDSIEPGLLVDLYLLKILPTDKVERADYNQKLIGTGPYELIKKESQSILLKRFEGYFEGEAKTHYVEFKIVKDETTKYLKLVRGEIDIAHNNLSPLKVDTASKRTDLKIQRTPGTGYNYIGFNLHNEKFQNVQVRKAIAMGLDIETVIKSKLKGYARQATSVLSPEFYYQAKLNPIPYNPKEAEKILDEIGYKRRNKSGMRDLDFEFKTSNNRLSVQVAQIFSDMLKKIGVQANVRAYEWGTFYGDIKSRNFDVYSLRWIGHVGPEFLYDLYHSVGVNKPGLHEPYFNRIGYSNPRVDELLEQGMRIVDPIERKPYFVKAQKIINADIPYISLWYPDILTVYNKNIFGVELDPTGNWKFISNVIKIDLKK